MSLDTTHNIFLVIRAVFLTLLMYFHVLILLFASWNVVVARSSGVSAPGASVFLLMNSVFIFVLVPVAFFAQLICAKARPAYVRVECTWTALMSVLQLAASIDVTVNGPAMCCQMHSPWAMCAFSSLLAHISWLATLIILSYCVTIIVASAIHAASLPDIWITPVSRVPWFCPTGSSVPVVTLRAPTQNHAKSLPPLPSSHEVSCDVSRYIAERWDKLPRAECQLAPSGPVVFTTGRHSVDPTRPAWARLQVARRGIDSPFAKPMPKRKEPPMVLTPPPRTHLRQVAISRDSRCVNVSERPETMRTHSSYSTLTAPMSTVFPWEITDSDLPIPRPSLSEWVRADAVRGIASHREPTPSP